MTNLTEKLDALEIQMTAQHNAVITAIGANTVQLSADLTNVRTRLDTIIDKLDGINTTLTNNGTYDPTPIVDAINNLRGVGEENTLRSINQSLWNIAGATPGASLLDLHDAIIAMRGIGPENTLKSINQSLWNLAGPAPGAALTDLKSVLQKIVDTLGDPSSTFPQTYTVRQLLAEIKAAWDAGQGLTAYNLLDTLYLAQVQLLEQFNTSVVTPTMKDLMLTISQQQALIASNTANPLTTPPIDCCAEPLVSIGRFFQDTTVASVAPVTFATWPETPGGDFTTSYDVTMNAYVRIHCTDWTAYRIYVASKSDTFGVITGRGDRYPCNRWVTLSIPEGIISGAAFNVDRANDLKVYICGAAAQPPALNADPGGCQSGIVYEARLSFDATGVDQVVYGTTWSIYHAVWPSVPGYLVASADGQIVSLDPSWAAANPGGSIQVCITWNFDSGTVAPQYELAWDDFDEGAVRNVYIAQPMLGPTGMVTTGFYSSRTTMSAIYVGGVPGTGVPSNMFIHVIPVSGMS